MPPEPLDGAIQFAAAGELLPPAMRALVPVGILAVAGIWLIDVPVLHDESELFHERQLRSVTANTCADGEEFLRLAARVDGQATTSFYPMKDAALGLSDLADGRFGGAAVSATPEPEPEQGPLPTVGGRPSVIWEDIVEFETCGHRDRSFDLTPSVLKGHVTANDHEVGLPWPAPKCPRPMTAAARV